MKNLSQTDEHWRVVIYLHSSTELQLEYAQALQALQLTTTYSILEYLFNSTIIEILLIVNQMLTLLLNLFNDIIDLLQKININLSKISILMALF